MKVTKDKTGITKAVTDENLDEIKVNEDLVNPNKGSIDIE
jgi:hypothetical protein